MRRYDSLVSKREQILAIAARYGARNVRVFGSVVRGEDGPESDVDLLVEFEPGRGLLNHAALIEELQNLLVGTESRVVGQKAAAARRIRSPAGSRRSLHTHRQHACIGRDPDPGWRGGGNIRRRLGPRDRRPHEGHGPL